MRYVTYSINRKPAVKRVEDRHIVQMVELITFGLKVFMDAYMPVTHEERDRYPLGPPKSFCWVRLSV